MPKETYDIDTLKEYLDGVLLRAEHRADAVNEVVLPLIGALIWVKDKDEPLRFMVREGKTTNVLWGRYK